MVCVVRPVSFLEDFPFLSFLRWRCASPGLLIGVAVNAGPFVEGSGVALVPKQQG